MIGRKITPIPYALELGDDAKTKMQTTNVLRNAQRLEQHVFITCSPRDERDRFIETVLNEVS